MGLKAKITSLSLALLMGTMIAPQLSVAAGTENRSSADVYIFRVEDVYILDLDEARFVASGQTGVYQTGFTKVGNVQPTGTIKLSSSNPDVLYIDENGAWEARQEGVACVSADSHFSDKTVEEIRADNPDYSFLRPSVCQYFYVYVSNYTSVFRLYNPNSGEHFYTESSKEKKALSNIGWRYEQISWVSAKDRSRPVYRLYNPNAGDHHYTASDAEARELVRLGWQREGVAMYAGDETDTPIYRLYNPNATTGAHHFTANSYERDNLKAFGWRDEGIAFYAASEEGVLQQLKNWD